MPVHEEENNRNDSSLKIHAIPTPRSHKVGMTQVSLQNLDQIESEDSLPGEEEKRMVQASNQTVIIKCKLL